jgi:ABC-type Fe3+ transport system permease subunit/sugar lactone lactonase YvrE
MNWQLIQNSLMTSVASTALAVAFGFVVALFLAGLNSRCRTGWLGLCAVALCLPPFLVTNCWLHYLGHAGAWSGFIHGDIYSLGGTVWILALILWPITTFATLGAWQRVERAQLEADMAVRGFALMRGLLLPSARSALLISSVLTFVLALNNFAVPSILQVKVFPAEVWVEFNTTFNTLGALKTSWPMIVAPLLVIALLGKREIIWPRTESPVSSELFRSQLGVSLFRLSGVMAMLLVFLCVGLPLFQLASNSRTWEELPGALKAGQLSILNSAWLAAVSATLCVLPGFLGWRKSIGAILWLPFLIPGVLMGIVLIQLFNHSWCVAFYQSAGIVVLALSVRYLALGWNGTARALRAVDKELRDVATLEGAGWFQTFRHVEWPQIQGQVMATWYVLFLLCLWDVESIVLVVPPGGETVALRIFNLLHYGHNAQVNSLCFALLAIAAVPLLAWQIIRWCGIKFVKIKSPALPLLIFFGAMIFFAGCSAQKKADDTSMHSKIFSSVEVIGSRGVGVGQFNKPRSVAVDGGDNLYVVDMTGRVQKFSPDGEFQLLWQMPQTDLGKPKGMGRDADGNVIVIEPHYQRINTFSREGNLLTQWGERGAETGRLIMPRAIAMDSHGDYFIPEYTVVDRVQKFSGKTHEFLQLIGKSGTGTGEFNRPEGIGIDSKDNLYVADSCNHRIQVFASDGHFVRSYGKPGTGLGEMSYPYDVRADKSGLQFVCEFENSRIQVFDADGKPVEIIGGPGYAPGMFNNPYAIALDSKGNLYVADSQNHRVQKLIRRKEMALL